MNSDKIVCIHHNYSNSLGQWYWYLILQIIMTSLTLSIAFCKLKIMELLIIELYFISNGLIINNSVISYGVSSNITLILFRILLIIFIFEKLNMDYIRVYYNINQWHQFNIDIKSSPLYQRYLVGIMNYISNILTNRMITIKFTNGFLIQLVFVYLLYIFYLLHFMVITLKLYVFAEDEKIPWCKELKNKQLMPVCDFNGVFRIIFEFYNFERVVVLKLMM